MNLHRYSALFFEESKKNCSATEESANENLLRAQCVDYDISYKTKKSVQSL